MAIAKNLKPSKIPSLKGPNRKKYLRYLIIGLVVLAISLGAYGILNLTRLAPSADEKTEVSFETGDRPLEQKIKVIVKASGGLNLRAEASAESEILTTIPNGTELEVFETLDDWYKVTYEGQTGWIAKDYVEITTEEETETSSTGGWVKYSNSQYSYATLRPEDWVVRDYGANQASNLLSYAAFGPQLPDQLDPANLPPVVIKVTSDSAATVEKSYQKKIDSVVSEATVAGQKSKMFTFTASSGVQMTAYVVPGGDYTYILEESGGYSGELSTVVKNLKLS